MWVKTEMKFGFTDETLRLKQLVLSVPGKPATLEWTMSARQRAIFPSYRNI
jgi:hypothetical protein